MSSPSARLLSHFLCLARCISLKAPCEVYGGAACGWSTSGACEEVGLGGAKWQCHAESLPFASLDLWAFRGVRERCMAVWGAGSVPLLAR